MFNQYVLRKQTGFEKLESLCGVHWGSARKGEMRNDHGERTNRKLNTQPFYHRDSNGKMRNY